MHQLDDNMGAANGWELTEEEVSVLSYPLVITSDPVFSLIDDDDDDGDDDDDDDGDGCQVIERPKHPWEIHARGA